MTPGQPASARSGDVRQVVELVERSAPAYPVVLVVGTRGSGRSTVLREAAAALDRPTVWIDCAVFDYTAPFQSLRDALSSSSPELFPRPMAIRLDAELGRTDLSVSSVERMVWSVVREGVAALAGRQVIADDFDLLDPQSQQVAAYVLRRIAQLGTPVLFSVETAGAAVERFPSVDLGPLEVAEARELIEDVCGAPVPYRVAERLAGRTDGNVLALVEIARELTDEQRNGRQLLPHPLPMPLSVARRLCAEDDDRLSLLAGLALDETVPVEVAERLIGSAERLQQAASDGLVRFQGLRVAAGQSATALAAWWLASATVRTRTHRVLAAADLPCAPIHGACIGQPVTEQDLARAAQQLYDLGRQGHAHIALELLDWVLPSSEGQLAQRLMDDGYVAAVRGLVAASATRTTGMNGPQVDSLRTQIAVLTGVVRDPITVSEIDHHPVPVTREWAQVVLGMAHTLMQRADYQGADVLLRETANPMADAPADCRALARFVRAELSYHRCEERALDDLVAAAEEWVAGHHGHQAINTAIMVFYLLAVGNPGLAGAILNQTQPTDRAGALTRVAHLIGRLHTELVLGHYMAAEHLIEQLDEMMPYCSGGAQALAPVIETAAARGPSRARDRIEWRLDQADAASQPPQARSELAASNGRRHLIEGDYERAVVLLGHALESRHVLFTGASSVLASLLEANLAAGATPAANRAVWKGLGDWWPDRQGSRFAGLQARCEALCVDADDIDLAFETAISRCVDGHPVDLGRTFLAYGRRLLLASRPADADRQLDRAQAIFAHERLAGWTAHIDRLRSNRHRPENGQLLTPTEREVVTLVLQRRTNSEIARTMFMSKRTVELHLTRVFRKFGVSRKSELVELDSVRSAIEAAAGSPRSADGQRQHLDTR